MGFRAASARTSSSKSALSGEAELIWNGTGYSVTGATIGNTTPITLGIVTEGRIRVWLLYHPTIQKVN